MVFSQAVKIGMLVVETVVRIRREYAAGKPIKAICRDLRLSRKVAKASKVIVDSLGARAVSKW